MTTSIQFSFSQSSVTITSMDDSEFKALVMSNITTMLEFPAAQVHDTQPSTTSGANTTDSGVNTSDNNGASAGISDIPASLFGGTPTTS